MKTGKRIVYDLTLRFDKKSEAEETLERFRRALYGNMDVAESNLCIFYGGGKTIRVVEWDTSRTHADIYRIGNKYTLKVLKDFDERTQQ